MKYAQRVNLGGTGFVQYLFSQNSAYDPNVTSTGGTVSGWATLAALYARARVTASKIKVTCQVSDPGNYTAAVAAFNVTPTIINVESVVLSRYAKPESAKSLSPDGYGPAVILKDSINTSELVGNELYDDGDLYMIGNSDPAMQFYWGIAASDYAGGAFGMYIFVELEYLVEWSQPQAQP